MTPARKALFDAFKPWKARPTPVEAMQLIDAYRAEVAHELAEEIRKDAGQHRVARERWAALRAAELIDPEVPGG